MESFFPLSGMMIPYPLQLITELANPLRQRRDFTIPSLVDNITQTADREDLKA